MFPMGSSSRCAASCPGWAANGVRHCPPPAPVSTVTASATNNRESTIPKDRPVQKLSISKRGGCQVAGSIVNRTQMHGKKEKVPAISIPITGIILTEGEFCTILQDAGAYEAFFTAERSQVMEPRFPG